MLIIPAIDIMGGNVVRLLQGRYEDRTVYSQSPVDMALEWDRLGAKIIHVVDLDGALTGKPANLGAVREIARCVKAKIEFGGGVRDEAAIESALGSGVSRVVIGTRALDGEFLRSVGKRFGPRIVAGIDAKDGMVCTKGWVFRTMTKAADLVKRVEQEGIGTVIYTDIARDGMLEGPNISSLEALLKSTSLDIVASGGITTLDDLRELKALESHGLVGAIIGKALYEGKIDLEEAMVLC